MSDLVKLESLPVETLAEMANEAAELCEASGRKTVEHAATCGRALLAAKAQLPHGQWMDWLTQNFHHSDRLARQYMEIANWQRDANLEDATSVRGALRLISDTPEKQAKKAEREAKNPEAPQKAPASPASAPTASAPTIRHEPPLAPQSQPEKPAWLADPNELDRPEEDDQPPLPKTNTHHTAANRREPDARETDRAGIVPPDDPRTLEDGAWYEWSEDLGRLVLVTDEDILAEADKIDQRRHDGRQPEMVTPAKKSMDTKPGKVPTAKALCSFAEERADIGTNRHLWSEQMVKGVQEWALYKQSLTGKAKVRSLEQWAKALTRIENVVAAQGWPAVADMLEKAIANGWQGWEHETDNGRKSAPVAPHRTYARLNKAEVKYDELPE